MVATGAAALGWLLVERIRDGHATSLGAASGVVAGLVAITPSCSVGHARSARSSLGCLAGVLCALAVGLKFRFGFDDSLDVVGVHLVGGLWGTLAVGLLRHGRRHRRRRRAVLRRRRRPALAQAVGALRGAVYSFVLTYVIGSAIQKTIGFRIAEEDEVEGIDSVEHAESAYDFATAGGGGRHPHRQSA